MHRSKFLRRTLVARYTQERASLIEIACESSSGYPALVPYGRHYAVRPPRDELARLIQATPTNGATSRGAAVSSMMRSRLCTPSRQDMDGQDLDASKANSISAPAHGFTHPGKGRPPERRSVRLVASSGSRSAGAKLFFLPKYSPDLNPMEQVSSSNTCCENAPRAPLKPSARQSACCSKPSRQRNAPITSKTPDVRELNIPL